MTRRLFLHIGLPKTGTTYLQTSMWAKKGALRRQGILLPLRSTFTHYVAALELREELPDHLAQFSGTLGRLIKRINSWEDDAIVSHELFTMASADQVKSFYSQLEVDEIHLVITARDVARQVPADWQETVKNGYLHDYGVFVADLVRDDPNTFFWRMQEIPAIVGRWAQGVSPDHVHFITVPDRGAAPDEIWRRFCVVIGVDPETVPGAAQTTNTSMGVAGTEFIRQIPQFVRGRDRITQPFRQAHIKQCLAQSLLAKYDDVPIGLQREHAEFFAAKSRGYVDFISRSGFKVVGDLESLVSKPEAMPDHLTPTAEQVVSAGLFGLVQLVDELSDLQRDREILIRRSERWRLLIAKLKDENAKLSTIRGGFWSVRQGIKRRLRTLISSEQTSTP